jgi:hypothetical protein
MSGVAAEDRGESRPNEEDAEAELRGNEILKRPSLSRQSIGTWRSQSNLGSVFTSFLRRENHPN